MRFSILKMGLALMVVSAITGCSREKADAVAALDQVKQACATNDRKRAQDIMIAAAEKNKTFAKSFQFVTADLPDKTMVDACGPVFDKVKAHLDEQ
jgi:hypothetical protein